MKRSIVGVVLALFLLSGCGSSNNSASKMLVMPKDGQASAAPMGGTYLAAKIPANILDLPLQDADGKAMTLGSLAGKTVIIANFLTSCQEICPMTTANMRDLAAAIAKSPLQGKVEVVEITVDAATDTPARMAAYQELYGAKNWTLATGSEKVLNTLWNYFGAPATKSVHSTKEASGAPLDWQTGKPVLFDFVHPDVVLIVNKNSTWSWMDLSAPEAVVKTLPDKMKAFLTEEGQNNLNHPQDLSWTSDTVLAALAGITGVKV